MLSKLKIKNIALIDECVIDFESGFNTLTGETGAGKSIIIDSLNFVLGARGDKGLIKSGTESARVEAVFDCSDETVFAVLSDYGIEPENTIILSRTLNLSGKNECRINGEIATLNMLKNVARMLVDVFGQNDQQFLLDVNRHVEFLDSFAGAELDKTKGMLAEKLSHLRDINLQIGGIGGDGAERERNIDLLRYQINEIVVSDLKQNEEDDLNARKNILLSSEKIAEKFGELNYYTDGDASVVSALKNSKSVIEALSRLIPDVDELAERFGSAVIEIGDVLDDLKSRREEFEYSESELDFIEDRLDVIGSLKRKYGGSIEEILQYLKDAKEKLDHLENATEELEKLKSKKNAVLREIFELCEKLTDLRKQFAIRFEQAIMSELKLLGMKSATFKVFFADNYNENNIEEKVTQNGADEIEFLFSANLGEPVKPLVKIISGGELSRFMLAFKTVVNYGSGKTYVFDEIDTGIGGEIGVVVGGQMCKVAKQNQVLCVTHLAQIASFSDHMLKISKSERAGKTYTGVAVLSGAEKINEVARMIGSANGEYAKLYAGELVNNSNNFKATI